MIFKSVRLVTSCLIALFLAVALACDGPVDPEPGITYLSYDDVPRWSWSGDKLVYSRPTVVDSIPGYYLFVVDTTGENNHPVLGNGVMAVWLPGDTDLVVMSVDFKLYRFNLNTKALTPLCDCVDARYPELHPLGRYLFYEDQGVADGWATSIYRMDLETRDTTHIVGGSFPALSPSGDTLVFYRSGSVRCLDMVSDSEWVVFSPAYGTRMDWSPDGDKVAIGNIRRKEYADKLFFAAPDGSSSYQFSTGQSPQFSRSGNRLAILRPGSGNLYHIFLIDPDGGNSKQVTF